MRSDVQQAVQLQQEGRLDEAEQLYINLLRASPQHFDAAHLLGVVYLQRGDAEGAARQIGAALSIVPDHAAALANLGNALSVLGRFGEAVDCYDKALSLKRDFTDALYNRGLALQNLGRREEAVESFDAALALVPQAEGIHMLRGNLLAELGRHEEALAAYDNVVALRPDIADAHLSRANTLINLKRPAEALPSLDVAIALNPAAEAAHVNKGAALHQLRQFPAALESLDRAIALSPSAVNGYFNRGMVYKEMRRFGEAVRDFDAVRKFAPDRDFIDGICLNARMALCDWEGYDAATRTLRSKVGQGIPATTPFEFLALPSSSAEQLACARVYAAKLFPQQVPLWSGEKYNHAKPRIAYISADFFGHATAHLMARLFELHDRAKFDITAISFSPDDGSAIQKRVRGAFGSFIDVSTMGDAQVAALLREKEIGIAIDLKGFTQDARPGIFAHRPAPVQVNYIGYPGTMGMPYIDYIIADHVLIPENLQTAYSEKVVYLPDTYQPNDNRRALAGTPPSRAALGLPEKGFVFASFNNPYKNTPDIFAVWMKLLKSVEGSVLWLLEPPPAAIANLRAEAVKHGVAAERIVFAPRTSVEDHLTRHMQADLFLDTLPYNAHTTASDALWAGLPVVTCKGETFASRVAASLLTAAGMPELITISLEDYEQLALKIARDPALLALLKKKLVSQRATCALFDTARYTRNLEAAYLEMWEIHQRGENSRHIGIARS